MRSQCQEFATALLDHIRTSLELEVILNHNPDGEEHWDPGERQTLERLKLAIKYKQKQVSNNTASKDFKLQLFISTSCCPLFAYSHCVQKFKNFHHISLNL